MELINTFHTWFNMSLNNQVNGLRVSEKNI